VGWTAKDLVRLPEGMQEFTAVLSGNCGVWMGQQRLGIDRKLTVSEYGLTSRPTQYRSFRGWPFQAECTQTHNNGTVSLTFTIKKQKV